MTRLEARNVSFQYRRAVPTLLGWSASFDAGSLTAITGASGRGKSTLLYILGLMLRPNAGHILVDGVAVSDLADSSRAQLRAQTFGFVFQDAALDPSRTILDNVTESAIYRGESRGVFASRARGLLAAFGVDVDPTRRPGQISGGQAQRVALCRALVHDPDVVLADEPTGNLDSTSASVVMAGLRDHAARGAAVVVVTHSSAVARMCDAELNL